jgi:putative membrane protein
MRFSGCGVKRRTVARPDWAPPAGARLSPVARRRVYDADVSPFVRLAVSAAALWVATRLVPGLSFTGPWPWLFAVALVFGVLNTVVRPILVFFSLPALLVTLGLFLLVLNGLMLWLTARVSSLLGLGFEVNGFTAAFLGALVVSIVTMALNAFVGTPHVERPRKES